MKMKSNKNYFVLLINAVIFVYMLFVIFFSILGSVPEYQSFIDGEEIKNVCDVLRSFVSNDIRGIAALVALIAIVPVVFYCIKIKFKSKAINLMLILFSSLWVWNYIIKYRNCLEFYIYTTSS